MKPKGHIDYQILLRDAQAGIRYVSFEDYYTRRLASRAIFFPPDAKGALLAVQTRVMELVRECWDSFAKDHPELIAGTADGTPADGCGGLPQAGGAQQHSEACFSTFEHLFSADGMLGTGQDLADGKREP